MIFDPNQPQTADEQEPITPRLFLREPGWRIGHKHGSDREFCHSIAPGQNYYHRLSDGEIFVYTGEEKLCIPCADRRGLLHFEPRTLRPALQGRYVEGPAHPDDTIPVADRDDLGSS